MALSDGEKIATRCLVVLIPYRSVTDRRTHGRNCHYQYRMHDSSMDECRWTRNTN